MLAVDPRDLFRAQADLMAQLRKAGDASLPRASEIEVHLDDDEASIVVYVEREGSVYWTTLHLLRRIDYYDPVEFAEAFAADLRPRVLH